MARMRSTKPRWSSRLAPGICSVSVWRSCARSGAAPDAIRTTMRRGTGRSSSCSPVPSHGSSRRAVSSFEYGRTSTTPADRAGDGGGLGDVELDVAARVGPDLDGHLAPDIGLPFARRGAHQHDRARRQRGQEGHDGDDRDQRAAGDRRLRHDRRLEARQRLGRRRGRRIGLARLLRVHRRVIRRHAGDLRAAPDGGRRTDPSARCRGWR